MGVNNQCKKNKILEGKLEGGKWGALLRNVMTPTPIIIRREAIGEVQDFKYLGSTLEIFGDLEKELSRHWGANDWKICSTLAHMVQRPNFIADQDGILQGLHLVNPTLQVRIMGTHIGLSRKVQCHPHGLSPQVIEGEVVVEIKQCRNHRCNIEQIPTVLNKTRMLWVGHMVRMGNIRFPMKIFFGGLASAGVRGAGEAET